MIDDQMSLPGQPFGWVGRGQDNAPAGKPPAKLRSRDQTAPQERLIGSPVSNVNQRPKAALKQLSLRIDDGTHSKISQAAQKADKSINAWMEEVLSEAADDALGSGGDGTIYSAAIRYLIEDPTYSRRLIEAIAPHLQDNSFAAIFQFSHPLRKLLVGWDRIKPLLQEKVLQENWSRSPEFLESLEPNPGVVKLTDAVLPYVSTADPALAMQFHSALKKFLLGIAAVKPFMREEKSQNLLSVVRTIEELVNELDPNPSGD